MTISEKINYLQDNNMGEWLKTRREVDDELSARQSMFCICGRLATGFHESSCSKYKNKVNTETVKRLS